jgi:hypothetical protein
MNIVPKVNMTTDAVLNTFKQEVRCIDLWQQNNPMHEYITTDKMGTAIVDGFIIRQGVMLAAVEQKSRNLSMSMLFDTYGGELLVDENKWESCLQLSKWLNVPFVMWTYLVPDDLVLSTMISNDRGHPLVKFEKVEGDYQESANGGRVKKRVAYFDVTTENTRVFRPVAPIDWAAPL